MYFAFLNLCYRTKLPQPNCFVNMLFVVIDKFIVFYQLRKLWLHSPINDKAIASIASCIRKIEELELNVTHVTNHGLELLSSAINKRITPVS